MKGSKFTQIMAITALMISASMVQASSFLTSYDNHIKTLQKAADVNNRKEVQRLLPLTRNALDNLKKASAHKAIALKERGSNFFTNQETRLAVIDAQINVVNPYLEQSKIIDSILQGDKKEHPKDVLAYIVTTRTMLDALAKNKEAVKLLGGDFVKTENEKIAKLEKPIQAALEVFNDRTKKVIEVLRMDDAYIKKLVDALKTEEERRRMQSIVDAIEDLEKQFTPAVWSIFEMTDTTRKQKANLITDVNNQMKDFLSGICQNVQVQNFVNFFVSIIETIVDDFANAKTKDLKSWLRGERYFEKRNEFIQALFDACLKEGEVIETTKLVEEEF